MTATELKKRAIALAEKTKIDSVTPEEVGQLSNDIVEYIENVEINGSSLGIRKTYTSVSAMEADSTAPKDDKGVLLRRGMLVNIYNQEEPDSADNGKVFSFQNPGWAFRGIVDAGYATKEELTELGLVFDASQVFPTGGDLGDHRYTFSNAREKVPSELRKPSLKLKFNDLNSFSNEWQYNGGGWNDNSKWIPTDGYHNRLYANKWLIITSGNVEIDFSAKTLSYNGIRAISQDGSLLIYGTQTMVNASIDFSDVYNGTIPVNAVVLINPAERSNNSDGILASVDTALINVKICEGWYILGYIRTVENKFIANIDKYISDGKTYYNNIAISDFITDERTYMKYVSPAVLNGLEVPYIENKILKENGELQDSTLKVTEPIIAFPGMVLHDVRTPGDTSRFCAIVYYDINNEVVGTFKSTGGSIIPSYKPELPANCLYLRYTTDKTDKPRISFEYKKLELDLVYFIGSSSVQRMETRDLGEYKLDMLINNTIIWSGVGAEDMQALTARGSIYPIFPSQGFTIPNDTTEVNIQGFSVRNKPCIFSNQQGNNLPKLNPVTINGVKGNIRYDNGQYLFKREIAGNSVNVTTSNVIMPNNIIYRGQILITMLGYNKGYETTEEYIECHKKAVEMFTTHRYLLVTRIVDGSWTNISTIQEEELEMLKIYGSNVFALREWLSSEGMKYAIDLGLLSTETEQDKLDKASGYVPTSLRYDGAHLTDIGYKIVSYKISEIIKQLGFVE